MKKLKNEELNRISVEGYKKARKFPLVIVLDNLRSLNNIGSVFRTADAFRVEKVILCGITGTPPHREIQKTALGATESVDWEYFESTIDAVNQLKKSDYKIVAIEQIDISQPLDRFKPDPDSKYALVFGNEVKGVSADVLDYLDDCIEIPQFGTKHSFNVSISTGIVLWHFFMNLNG